jgi:tetratricopeptide (TPR) repeat protein
VQSPKKIDEKMLKKLFKIVEVDNAFALPVFTIALHFEKEQNCDQAARYYNQLILRNGCYYPKLYIKSARNYRICQSYDKAKRVLSLADQKGFKTPELYLEKAQLLEKTRDFSEAKKIYQEIIKLNPDHPGALLFLARQKREAKMYDAALELVDRLINQSIPDQMGPAYLEKGENLVALNRNSEAEEVLKKATSILTDDPRPFQLLGEIYFNKRDYLNAARYFNEALKQLSTNLDLLMKTATSLRKANKNKKALEILMKYKSNFYDTKVVTKEIGLLKFNLKEYAEAKGFLEACVNIKPPDPEVFTSLGSIYASTGENSKAISMFDRAMSIAKDKEFVKTKLAHLYLKNKDYNKAEKLALSVISIKPDYPLINQYYADILIKKGEHQKALNHYLKERKAHGNNKHLQENIAHLYYTLNQLSNAETEAQALIKMDPKNRQAYYYLTIVSLKQKNVKKAESNLKKVESLGKLSAQNYQEIGKMFAVAESYKRAIEFYNQSLKLSPKNQTALEEVAKIYVKTKQDSAAARIYVNIYKADNVKNQAFLSKAGHTYYKSGLTTQALKVYTQFVNKGYDDPLVFLNKAKIEFDKKKYSATITTLGKLTGEYATKPKVLKLYVLSYYYSEKFSDAIPYIKKLTPGTMKDPVFIEIAAQSYEKINDPASAITMYQRYLTIKEAKNHRDHSYHLGTLYEKTNQTEKAIAQYEENIRLYPKDIHNFESLSMIYVKSNKYNQAKRVLIEALKKPGAPVHLNRVLADIYSETGEKNLAISKYEKFLQKNPTDTSALFNLGSVYFSLKSYKKAIRTFEKAVRNMPSSSEALYKLGYSYAETGNYQTALLHLKKAQKLNSADTKILDLLTKCYTETNKLPELIGILKKRLALKPDDFALNFQLGDIYIKTNKIPQAISSLEAASRAKPSDVNTYIKLISLYKDNPEKRFEHINNALQNAPDNADLQYEKATYLLSQKKNDEAMETFQKVISLDTKHDKAHYNYGQLLKKQNRYEEAFAHFGKAMEFESANTEYLYSYAEAANLLNKNDLALETINKATKIEPKNAKLMQLAGYLTFKNGDDRKGEQLINKALAIDSKCPECHKNLGNIYISRSDYTNAILHLTEALKHNDKDDATMILLGNALVVQKQNKRALTYFEKAYEVNPDNGQALFKVCDLYITLKKVPEAEMLLKNEMGKRMTPWIHITNGRVLEAAVKYPEAITAYNHGIHSMPNNSEAHNGLGRIYLKEKKYEDAITSFAMAMIEKPDDIELVAGMGKAYLGQRNFEAAKELFNDVIKKQPKNPEAYKIIGLTYRKSGNHVEAAMAFKSALKYDPKNVDCHFTLALE